MKTILLIFILVTISCFSVNAQSAEPAKRPEAVQKEAINKSPQKPEPSGVKTVTPDKPNITPKAKPKQGAKPEVIRPGGKKRPAGAGRPAGVKRPPVRKFK